MLESISKLYGDFDMNSYNVDNDKVMKRGNEAFKASYLTFFRSVEHFTASSLRFFFTQRDFDRAEEVLVDVYTQTLPNKD